MLRKHNAFTNQLHFCRMKIFEAFSMLRYITITGYKLFAKISEY